MNFRRTSILAVLAFLPLSAFFSPSRAAAPDPAANYPVERAADAGPQWRKMLGISAEQARRLTALENEKAARLKPLRELQRAEMVTLQARLAEGAPEGDVRDCLEQLLQIRRVIAERTARFDDELADFLSPSQRARLFVWQSLGGLDGYAARRLEAATRLDEETERN
jgi:hypothetical protein